MNNSSIVSNIADKLGNKTHMFFIILSIFLSIIVLLFFISALTGKACGNSKIEIPKRVIYCNISIKSSSVFQSENRTRSFLFFDRGALLSITGENIDAISDFRTAVNFASKANDPDEVKRRIERFISEIIIYKNMPNVEQNWLLAISQPQSE